MLGCRVKAYIILLDRVKKRSYAIWPFHKKIYESAILTQYLQQFVVSLLDFCQSDSREIVCLRVVLI